MTRTLKRCSSLVAAAAIAAVLAPAPAHATVSDSGDAYVCMVGLSPHAADIRGGTYGYLYIQVSSQPACAGTSWGGYIYTTGATFTGTEWRTTSLYTEAGLMAMYQSLTEAAQAGKRVQIQGSNQSPHYQVYTATIKSY